MKLGSLKEGGRDGTLIVVSRDLTRAVRATGIAPTLQRSPAATEAISLMIGWAFDAGYRRVEWKCNALNEPSRSAARRYGFTFEGVFRQHMITKGRNRDSAWFAIIDSEWPALARAHDAWLAPGNFDAEGRQRQSLSALTAAAMAQGTGPGAPDQDA